MKYSTHPKMTYKVLLTIYLKKKRGKNLSRNRVMYRNLSNT